MLMNHENSRKVLPLIFMLLLIMLCSGCDSMFKVADTVIDNNILWARQNQYRDNLVEFYDSSTDTGEIGTPKIHAFYSNLSNFKQLDQYSVKDEPIDKYIDMQTCVDAYTRNIQYEEYNYSIFAYQFKNADDARRYFDVVAETNNWPAKRYFSWKLNPSFYIAYDGAYALRIEGDRWETIAYLMSSFEDVFDYSFPDITELLIEMLPSQEDGK